jgi:hypothetical protein
LSRRSGWASLAVCAGLAIGGAAPVAAAEPEGACGSGLPASKLALLDSKFDRIEQTVSVEELAMATRVVGGHAGRDFLLVDPPARGWLTVEHRVIRSPSDPTVFCNSPARVNVALGYGERRMLVTPDVAGDHCIMDALRAHETLHAELEERDLGLFIDEHVPALGAAMAKLKSTPAPSVDIAKKQFEVVGLSLIRALERLLLVRKADLRRQVDTQAELAGLAGRCNGRVGWFRDARKEDI